MEKRLENLLQEKLYRAPKINNYKQWKQELNNAFINDLWIFHNYIPDYEEYVKLKSLLIKSISSRFYQVDLDKNYKSVHDLYKSLLIKNFFDNPLHFKYAIKPISSLISVADLKLSQFAYPQVFLYNQIILWNESFINLLPYKVKKIQNNPYLNFLDLTFVLYGNDLDPIIINYKSRNINSTE